MSKKFIHTRKRYLALAAVFVLLGLGLVFLPERDNKKELKPEHLLVNLADNSRFISCDEVADKLVNNDPSMMLIDVRNRDEFEKGSLPGALNIPLNEVANEASLKVFGRKAYDKVIFSNNDILADQAWTLLSRELVENTSILKGGINEWVTSIINPVAPKESAPIEAFEQFEFRKAASRYFSGQSKAFEYMEFESQKKPVKSKSVRANKPKTTQAAPVLPPPVEEEEEEEGC